MIPIHQKGLTHIVLLLLQEEEEAEEEGKLSRRFVLQTQQIMLQATPDLILSNIKDLIEKFKKYPLVGNFHGIKNIFERDGLPGFFQRIQSKFASTDY